MSAWPRRRERWRRSKRGKPTRLLEHTRIAQRRKPILSLGRKGKTPKRKSPRLSLQIQWNSKYIEVWNGNCEPSKFTNFRSLVLGCNSYGEKIRNQMLFGTSFFENLIGELSSRSIMLSFLCTCTSQNLKLKKPLNFCVFFNLVQLSLQNSWTALGNLHIF